MTQRCFEVYQPITKIIASRKRIHQGVHPPVEYQQVTKSHPAKFFIVSKRGVSLNKNISLFQIFCVFLYSGLILLGGGYIILPILKTELVEKRNWLTDEELMDYYAISQSLPGLIAINMSVLVGYKLRGKWGALSGVLGITFFAFWAIVLLSSIISGFTDNIYIQMAFWGIEIAVVVLIISAVREMWSKSVFDLKTLVLYLMVLLLMLFTKISPAIIIISSIIVGIVYKTAEHHLSKKSGGGQ